MATRHGTETQAQHVVCPAEGVRRAISIRDLLRWAYRRHRVDAALRAARSTAGCWPAGYGRDSVARVARAGALGYVAAGGGAEGSAGEAVPYDALVVARYVGALDSGLREAVLRAALDDPLEPPRPVWPAPRLEPAAWQLWKGGRRPKTTRHPTLNRPWFCEVRLEPDPEGLLRQDRVYRTWWRGLQVLDRVIAEQEWELSLWRLSRALPQEAEPVPAWASGWIERGLTERTFA